MKPNRLLPLLLMLVAGLLPACGQSRDEWQQPERIMDVAGFRPGMYIGEIGAGEGYFTFKLAERVGPAGKVYANEIQSHLLQTVRDRARQENITNIVTVLGAETEPQFPAMTLDGLIMVYVFHHLSRPVEYLHNLRSYFGEDTRLVIVERDPVRYRDYMSDHFMKKERVFDLLKQADYRLIRLEEFPRDNIFIVVPD
ncbi:MAG: methyltransferase domain-containing protein [Acidobacteria bacterium]|nr:methyltransferase domain-containing protein [Acidobacteriota bacterium]